MRYPIICAVFLFGAVYPALADEMPVLRGSQVYVPGEQAHPHWGGSYVGGQVGFGSGSGNFAKGTSDLTAYILRNTTIENEAGVSSWTTLPTVGTSGLTFGAFIGYNMQWDNAVLGLELNYNRANFSFTAANSISRSYTVSTGYFYDLTVTGAATLKITDYATARMRAAWATDWALPYGFIGLAVGRANAIRTSTVDGTATDVVAPIGPNLVINETLTDKSSGVYAYGYTFGTGAEFALTQNMFLRAEYEHVWFPRFKGINVNLDTARAAAGFRF